VYLCHVSGCQGAISCFAIEGALTVTLFHLSICNLFMFMGVLSCFAIESALTVTLFHIVHLKYNLFMGVRVPSLALQ
jgi:hypothetical protein